MQRKVIAAVLGSLFLSRGASTEQYRPTPEGIKLERTLQLINSLYVDDADSKKLTEAAIRAMLEELDPHSTLPQRRGGTCHERTATRKFRRYRYPVQHAHRHPLRAGGNLGWPFAKVGLMPGDKIIKVNDTVIAGVNMNSQDVVKMLRGPKGTAVNDVGTPPRDAGADGVQDCSQQDTHHQYRRRVHGGRRGGLYPVKPLRRYLGRKSSRRRVASLRRKA